MSTYRFRSLLDPASVAVVGASPRAGSVGGIVLNAIVAGGYKGSIHAINPKHGDVNGVPCHASLSGLAIAPELVVVSTPPRTVEKVLAEAVAVGSQAAIVLTAGLGSSPESIAARALAIAREAGLRLVGPNCIGVLAPHAALNASFATRLPKPGSLALISQSGAIAAGLIDWAGRRDIGFSGIVSIGDALEVDVGDCLDWFAEDATTKAILLYVEAIRDARKFMSAARKATRVKPVIVIKAGRHAAGARAAATHTGALAGSDAVYDAAIRRAGCLRVFDLEELFATAETLAVRATFRGERLAILTNGGGLGVLAADRLEDQNGCLAELSARTVAELDRCLPPAWSHGNPVDIVGDAPPARYVAALEALMADGDVDAILALNCPTAVSPASEAADAIINVYAAHSGSLRKPLFSVWLGADQQQRRRFEDAGISAYESESAAVGAITSLIRLRAGVDRLLAASQVDTLHVAPDRSRASAAIAQALRDQRTWLTPVEAFELLCAYGIETLPVALASDPERAREVAQGFLAGSAGCVVKILSRDIVHKSEVDGVRLGLTTADAVEAAARDILARARNLRPEARIDGVTVQPMILRPHARELIVGMAVDPTFGPVILFGHGGTAVEVINDKALTLLPVDMYEAQELVSRTRIARLLVGYRNVPAANAGEIAALLVRVSRLVEDHPQIIGLDLNPVLADENAALALDVRVQVAAVADPSARDRRFAVRPYPRGLEGVVTLRDGAAIAIRPIRPADAEPIVAMLKRCSPADIRMRFLAAMSTPDQRLIARLTQIDYDRDMAFIALEPTAGDALGVVRLHGDANGEKAEFAIIVRTDWQGRGLGHQLLERLISFARSRGLAEIWGVELVENTAMLQMSRRLGFVRRDSVKHDGLAEMVLSLRDPAVPSAV